MSFCKRGRRKSASEQLFTQIRFKFVPFLFGNTGKLFSYSDEHCAVSVKRRFQRNINVKNIYFNGNIKFCPSERDRHNARVKPRFRSERHFRVEPKRAVMPDFGLKLVRNFVRRNKPVGVICILRNRRNGVEVFSVSGKIAVGESLSFFI